ncbi:restriction endonuclease subunit S [Acinetobacter johnsonii]|uniref:restriction endonuclease subunit S n=1 Tax=Acinetobacter johnsonii TaxID=40214 RepID=UPI003D170C2D
MTAPKLRFKEFDGDWTKYKIAEVTEYLVDGTHFSPKSTDGEFKYITSKNIRNDGLDLTNISYISKDEHESIYKRCKVQLGDILLTKDGANTGNCCLNTLDEEFSLLSSVAVLRGKNQSFDNNFILQILQSDLGQNMIVSSMSGQAITRITLTKLKDYSFHFPEFKEQTKIASFLSAVDEKIAQLSQKHQLLSQYKQGMMQKLFSQQIRFKADDGSEFEEWESRTLAEVGENIIGLTYSPTDVTNDGSGILVLRSSNIKNGRLNKNDQVRVNKKIKDKILVQPNDILICTRNGSQRLIGKSVIINDNEVMTFGAFMSVYRSQYNRFIAYLMQTPWFFEQVQMNLGARINQITTGTLNEFTFDFPCLEEQTKIANFLSAIDQKIEVTAQQIEQAKQWKKGLLQQMFV